MTKFFRISSASLVAAIILTGLSAWTQESPYRSSAGYPRFEAKQEVPGLNFGVVSDLPLPKTLLYSVTPDELLADGQAWIDLGYGGFFLTGVAGEWSADVWAADGAPWTVGESDETLQKVRRATAACDAKGAEVFLTSAFSHPFDWFDDVAWQHIEERFRQMAVFARVSGCTGLAIDIEYIHQQYHFNWEGYTYDGYTRSDLVEAMRRRMTGVAEAMYDAFPEMVLLTLPESMATLGSHVQNAWLEEAARRNAPGGLHVCTEYTYRRPNPRFMLGHAWMINDLFERTLSPRAFRYWREHGSTSGGIWTFGEDPDDFHGVPSSPGEFRQAFAASLMGSSRYNWIYSHNARPWMIGRESKEVPRPDGLEVYTDIVRKREVITNPEYVRIAQSIRKAEKADYEKVLGLTIVPTMAGPREELEVGLMPVPLYEPSLQSSLREPLWDLGLKLLRGEDIDRGKALGTQREWQLTGPFDNKANRGFDTVYPPEQGIDLAAKYDTPNGPVGWMAWQAPAKEASINLASIFQPADDAVAYALCYLESDTEQVVHLRVGANDGWKLWVGGELVMSYADNGRIILDREVIPVTLKPGKTPVLLKVCNIKKDWGFIFRVTTPDGKPWSSD